MRQFPSPSAATWLIRLAVTEAPTFVVLRQDEADARACLSEHLMELGVAGHDHDAAEIVSAAQVEYTEVVW